jgi:TonB family protein
LIVAIATPALGQGGRREEQEPPPPKLPVLTAKPELLQAVPPEYPPEAAARGLEASVEVQVHVDAGGDVTRVDIPNPVGNGFDEAARAAALQYKFKPAEFDGKPGPIVIATRINFVLEKVEVPVEPDVPDKPDGEGGAEPATGPPSHGGDYSKPIAIEGLALERGTRKKLAGIIVSITELGIDAVSDESGTFYFHGIAPGKYTLIAVGEGYDRFTRDLEIRAGEVADIRAYIRPRGGNPYQTVVEGEREVLEVTRRKLDRRQLTTVPGTFGDPIRVIQTLPGLARTPFATGFLVIRGSNPDDSGVFIDGHRVPLLFHFLGGPSILNAEFLDQIELYPGGYPARFGRSIGGIVSVETRPAKSDGVHGSADVDLLDAGAYVRGPIGKNGAIAAAGRRSYLNLILPAFLPERDEGDTLLVVPVYFDYQTRLDYDLEREGRASLFFIGSGDRLDVLSADQDAEEFFNLTSEINFFRVIGSYKRPITDAIELTISPAWGRDSILFEASQMEGQAAATSVEVRQDVTSYRMGARGRLARNVYLDTGIDIESRNTSYDIFAQNDIGIEIDSDDVNLASEQIVRATEAYLYGLHADLAIDIDKLRLIPGVRFDGHLLGGRNRLSADPRIVARYQVHPAWVAKGYVGAFHQPPAPEALDIDFGNPELGVERAIHVGLGAEWRPSQLWKIDGEVYYIDRQNQVGFSNNLRMNPETGALERINFLNTRIGNTYGFELLVKREVTRNMFGWLSYTVSRSVTQRDPAETAEAPTPFDQTHNLNAVYSYKTDGGWELGARFRLTTGRPDTPVIGGVFDADEGDYDPINGAFGSAREPMFHQLDVRAEKTWVFKTWTLGTYLDVQNLYNAENPEATQFDYRFNESAPIRGIPLLPTLGVRGRF